jgi:hypothetical protein
MGIGLNLSIRCNHATEYFVPTHFLAFAKLHFKRIHWGKLPNTETGLKEVITTYSPEIRTKKNIAKYPRERAIFGVDQAGAHLPPRRAEK